MTDNNKKPTTKMEEQKEIQKLKKELQEKTELAESRLNQAKYLQADFENYKKLVEKERENFIKFSNEKLIKELLTLIDDLERAIQSTKDKDENKEILTGLKMINGNFLKTLEGYGLRRIESVGKKFNLDYHEAISKEESDKENDIVLNELQKGYLLNSKVLRQVKVKVSVKKNG